MTIGFILKELKETFSPQNWTVYGRNSRNPSEPIRIAICDDYLLYRRALSIVLAQHPDFVVVLQAANGWELLAQIPETQPDIVLLDLDMPVMDGETTANYLLLNHPNIRVILLATVQEHPALPRLMKRGVRRFVYKAADPDEFESAIRELVPRRQYWKKRSLNG